MHKSYFISAGASCRPNVSDTLNDLLIYASGSNIIIADELEVKNVFIRDKEKEITFLYTTTSELIICDIIGNVEVYIFENLDNHQLTIKKCVSFGSELFSVAKNDSIILAASLTQTFIYKNNSIIMNSYSEIITSVEHLCEDIFLIAFDNGEIELNDCKIKKKTIKAHQNSIKCVKVQKVDGQIMIASVSADSLVKVWLLQNFELTCKSTLFGHSDIVYSCRWLDCKNLITCSADNNIIQWTFANDKWSLEKKLSCVKGRNFILYSALVLCNKIIGQLNTGGFCKFEDDKCVSYITGHTHEVVSLDCCDDLVLTASLDGSVRIFSILLKQEICRPQIHGYPMQAARFTGNKAFEFISGAQETILRVYKPTF
ncbi:Elongator subunit elp2, partial [Conglomerata obtusa]